MRVLIGVLLHAITASRVTGSARIRSRHCVMDARGIPVGRSGDGEGGALWEGGGRVEERPLPDCCARVSVGSREGRRTYRVGRHVP
jgi:hypothetical protein